MRAGDVPFVHNVEQTSRSLEGSNYHIGKEQCEKASPDLITVGNCRQDK